MSKILLEFADVFKRALNTWLILLKIMIPISIIVKILVEFGLINTIADLLSPIMGVVGLPGEFGLVWATALATNIYGSLLVFAGARLWFMFLLRFFGAFILGGILNYIFNFFNLYRSSINVLLISGKSDNSIIGWGFRELRTYFMIFFIIFILLLLIRLLEKSGFINKLNGFLEPGLEILGMSKEAAPVSIIGTTLGISYGGGLIINESKKGVLSKKDMFLSLSMMGLTHSIIEDTLLMITIGAALSGILIGRIIFTVIVMILLIKIINFLPKSKFEKFFIR